MTALTWADRLAAVLVSTTPRQVEALPLVYPICEMLQLRETINRLHPTRADIDLGRLVEVLTLNRLLAPCPLSRVGPWVAQTVIASMLAVEVAQLYDQRFGRGLAALHASLGAAWGALVSRAVQQEGVDLSVLHWDTTTLHLTGAYADSQWAAYGRSSEHHSDRKLIKLGLEVTKQERVPVLYGLLAGATADITTAVPQLAALAAFLRRPECATLPMRPLVVGDCKMITPAAVAAAHQHHLYYLGPWEQTNAVEAVLRSVSDAELAPHELTYRPQRQFPAAQPFVPYRGVWRPFTVTYQGVTYADRALVVWSAGKQRLDEQKRKAHLKALLDRLAEIRSYLNQGRYIRQAYAAQQIALAQRGNPAKGLVTVALTGEDRQLALAFRVNPAAVAQTQALDGRYLLGTNAPALSADEALATFKAQDGVEKRHADLKGPLQLRPLYLHTDRRLESLVFITLVALLVWAILELRCRRAGLNYSAERLLAEFAPLYAIDQLFQDGSRLTQLGPLSPFQQQVLDALRLPVPTRYLHHLLG
jgi:transposase